MSDLDSRCLDAFHQWLKSLGSDVNEVGQLLTQDDLSEPLRQHAARAVNYLFKSLDLIPDGTEDLGFIDDAFVLRVSAALARAESDGSSTGANVIDRLSDDARLIEEFLGDDYKRLESYVQGLNQGAVRGRTIDEILSDSSARQDALGELDAWATSYECPSFNRASKNLVKLKSYLSTKLPDLS